MSFVGTSKGLLEVAKFAVYVTVPIGLMYFFANNTKNFQKFMGTYFMYHYLDSFLNFLKRQYVVYRPEGPRPPSAEELREMAREVARKREREKNLKN